MLMIENTRLLLYFERNVDEGAMVFALERVDE